MEVPTPNLYFDDTRYSPVRAEVNDRDAGMGMPERHVRLLIPCRSMVPWLVLGGLI